MCGRFLMKYLYFFQEVVKELKKILMNGLLNTSIHIRQRIGRMITFYFLFPSRRSVITFLIRTSILFLKNFFWTFPFQIESYPTKRPLWQFRWIYKNGSKFTRKYLCRSSWFYTSVCNFWDSNTGGFPANFTKYLRTLYS